MGDIKSFLGGIEEFKALDDESLGLLASSAKVEEFGEGHVGGKRRRCLAHT
jgi:hypothetical protein